MSKNTGTVTLEMPAQENGLRTFLHEFRRFLPQKREKKRIVFVMPNIDLNEKN